MSSSQFEFASHPKGFLGSAWSLATADERHDARSLVTARQAWQFAVVPLARRGNRLTFATSAMRRARAERFVTRVLHMEPNSQILDEPTLAACLDALYPLGNGRFAFCASHRRWARPAPPQ